MKLYWKFQWEGGSHVKTSLGGGMDIFWNHTMTFTGMSYNMMFALLHCIMQVLLAKLQHIETFLNS